MSSSPFPVPEVSLKRFVARQWWALVAGLAAVAVIGSFVIGAYTLVLLYLAVWFYAAAALLLAVARPLLLRRPDGLAGSRGRRMLRVLALAGAAWLVGGVAFLLWNGVRAFLSGHGASPPTWEHLCWVFGPLLAIAAVHVLSAWMFEWLGGHTAAKRLGIPS
ncbi:hypothetical protein [Zhihengliuella halotolerans]|uniref:hypothetical protein n=1 Tax=Zhihengliuella halotolerans TaxID=370736 RepID=UPI000C7FA5B8|nr:hypothetical protein [Zhihengliuella halotolerans]